jgi:hypothetical protein
MRSAALFASNQNAMQHNAVRNDEGVVKRARSSMVGTPGVIKFQR